METGAPPFWGGAHDRASNLTIDMEMSASFLAE